MTVPGSLRGEQVAAHIVADTRFRQTQQIRHMLRAVSIGALGALGRWRLENCHFAIGLRLLTPNSATNKNTIAQQPFHAYECRQFRQRIRFFNRKSCRRQQDHTAANSCIAFNFVVVLGE